MRKTPVVTKSENYENKLKLISDLKLLPTKYVNDIKEEIQEVLQKFNAEDEEDGEILNTPLPGYNGYCLQHLMAKDYDAKLMKILMKKGANPNLKGSDNNSCLHLLFTSTKYLNDDPKCFYKEKKYKQTKIDPKQKKEENTKRLETLKAIFEGTIKPALDEPRDQNPFETPLCLAIENRFIDETIFLIEKGATVTKLTNDWAENNFSLEDYKKFQEANKKAQQVVAIETSQTPKSEIQPKSLTSSYSALHPTLSKPIEIGSTKQKEVKRKQESQQSSPSKASPHQESGNPEWKKAQAVPVKATLIDSPPRSIAKP